MIFQLTITKQDLIKTFIVVAIAEIISIFTEISSLMLVIIFTTLEFIYKVIQIKRGKQYE